MTKLVHVCNLEELQPGDKLAITTDGENILVANIEGNVLAVSNICTHEYAELVNGFLIDDTITCPLHLSRFKLETGEVLNLPATKPLKTYKVLIQDSEVYIEI